MSPDFSRSDVAQTPKRISKHYVLDLMLLILVRPDRFAAVLFWRVLGKKVRARWRMASAVASLPFATQRRMARSGKRDLRTLLDQAADGDGVFCVHIHCRRDDELSRLRKALKASIRQSETPTQIFVTLENGVPDPPFRSSRVTVLKGRYSSHIGGLEACLEESKTYSAKWMVSTSPRTKLTRHALAAFHASLRKGGASVNVGVLYGDHMEETPAFTASVVWLKPKWDPRMFLSQDYVTQACALAIDPALSTIITKGKSRPESLDDLVARIAESHQIEHVERVVASVPVNDWREENADRVVMLQRRLGNAATVKQGTFGTTEVHWSLPEPRPTVSVIVATRDRVELLRTCVEGVLQQTDYSELELIIADNGSVEPETLAYMDEVAKDPRVQIVRWPHPFNYSAINNFAATHARGEFLCLLNNDIEIIDPDWLTEMMREACQQGIGAVGARLLYPDHTIQHAGVAIGIGNAAGHAHRGQSKANPGYFAQTHIARGATAVTAACLLVRKEHFDAVAGLDEKQLAVAYNDVDFCLKLRERGLSNIYTPLATLIHHESKSRGLDFAPEHLERYLKELSVFQERWNATQIIDPWHHRHLERTSEQYT